MKDFDHWRKTALEELIQTEYPICYGVLKPGNYDDSGVPLLRIVDLENNVVRDVGLHQITRKLDNEFSRSKLKGGELLVSIQGTVGRVAIAPEWAAGANISRTIARVAIAREKGNAQFIRQWLLSGFGSKALKDSILGTTRDSLNLSALRKIQIPLPSPPEQTKIAEILSTVDRAIEQTEAIIAKQQRIKTGLMQDLLTCGIDEHGNLRSEETHEFKDSPLGRIPVEWEVKPIEQKLEHIIDYRGRTPKKVVAGIPLLTAKNVRDGYLSEEPREFIAEENYKKWMTRGIPECGNVMFTTEAPMGNVARVPDYKLALAQRVLTLSSKRSELTNEYLFWILHWSNSRERLEALTSGSTVVGIKQSVFRKVLFKYPKVDEQKEIAKTLDSHEKIVINEKRKLEKLHSLKTALMQDLLTGKKRVTTLLNDTEVVHG